MKGMGVAATPWARVRREAEGARQHRFDKLAAQHRDRFWAYAYRLCGNPTDADDLLAETMLEAYQSFDAYQGHGFDRWVFRILTTNRIDQTRRARRRPAQPLSEYPEPISGAPNPLDRLLNPLLSEELQLALQKLPESFRTPLLLCDVEGLDYAAIATRLEIPLGTVRSRIHRARERLHRELGQFCHTKDCPVCGKEATHKALHSCR
jgi:RNA polymerase sigma-70 factor, ECF subfamily